MMKKALDTNIIVYSILEDHPTSAECDAFISSGRYAFYATPLTPFEVYFILRRVYNVGKKEASSKALSLFDSPLKFLEIGVGDAETALKRCITYDIDMNDSLLVQACLGGNIPSLTSDDRRLLRVSEAEGIQPQTPIGEEHRRKMNEWEEKKLAPSGLPRFLKRIHSWLEGASPEVAEKFFKATGGFRHLPD